MKHGDVQRQLQAEMTAVHVSPQLRYRTVNAALGKEKPVMKRKMSAALIVALIVILLVSVAVAAATRWGMKDFWSQYQDAYVPEDAENYMQSDVMEVKSNDVAILVRETYYDGISAYAAIDVTPVDGQMLLLPEYLSMTDRWGDLTKTEKDATILEVWRERGEGAVMAIGVYGRDENAAANAVEHVDAVLGEDGVLTFFVKVRYEDYQTARNSQFECTLIPYQDPALGEDGRSGEWKAKFNLTVPLQVEQETYSLKCETPQVYERIGVQVDGITLEVTPMNILARIAFTVVDADAFAAQDGAVWFEFIDPDSTESTPYAQQLKSGLDTDSWIEETVPGHYVQVESLGRNEYHACYSLRAYNSESKERFETRTFAVQEDSVP